MVREVPNYQKCASCKGIGQLKKVCEKCFGTRNMVGKDEFVYVRKCNNCSYGYDVIFTCTDCNGRGSIINGTQTVESWE